VAFQEVQFRSCKLLGLDFAQANPFGFSCRFADCLLNHTSFYRVKLNNSEFNNCQLEGADFTEAEMKGTAVINCNLHNAVFSNTNLEKSDFRQSVNYSIDAENNRIKGARFSLPEVLGLLYKYQIKVE
jgi:uncharacterized protein YjbI with pentapeptide repeats